MHIYIGSVARQSRALVLKKCEAMIHYGISPSTFLFEAASIV